MDYFDHAERREEEVPRLRVAGAEREQLGPRLQKHLLPPISKRQIRIIYSVCCMEAHTAATTSHLAVLGLLPSWESADMGGRDLNQPFFTRGNLTVGNYRS